MVKQLCQKCGKALKNEEEIHYGVHDECEFPRQTGAICGDGMCPYVPCKNYPNCEHVKQAFKDKEEGYEEWKCPVCGGDPRNCGHKEF